PRTGPDMEGGYPSPPALTDQSVGPASVAEGGSLRAGAVQLNSTKDTDRNLEVADRLVRDAAGRGAELVVLPEKWSVLGSRDQVVLSGLAGGASLGMSICYDLRFPELYRILAVRGAEVVAIPSAFTLATTRDHWEPLLRARAIENQCFVIAPNQVGAYLPGRR